MIYILTVSKVNPPEEKVLERLERIHTNPNLEVARKYVDEELPNGFTIAKEDNFLGYMMRTDKDLRRSAGLKHTSIVAKEKAFLKKQAKYSGDTSLTEGVKPYDPKAHYGEI
jgi:hypothetical protein